MLKILYDHSPQKIDYIFSRAQEDLALNESDTQSECTSYDSEDSFDDSEDITEDSDNFTDDTEDIADDTGDITDHSELINDEYIHKVNASEINNSNARGEVLNCNTTSADKDPTRIDEQPEMHPDLFVQPIFGGISVQEKQVFNPGDINISRKVVTTSQSVGIENSSTTAVNTGTDAFKSQGSLESQNNSAANSGIMQPETDAGVYDANEIEKSSDTVSQHPPEILIKNDKCPANEDLSEAISDAGDPDSLHKDTENAQNIFNRWH